MKALIYLLLLFMVAILGDKLSICDKIEAAWERLGEICMKTGSYVKANHITLIKIFSGAFVGVVIGIFLGVMVIIG